MKFDVIIGNPPYQLGKGKVTNRQSAWAKFWSQSFRSIVRICGLWHVVNIQRSSAEFML